MKKDDLTLLKANILGGLNELMKEYAETDENWLHWLTYGVPDECDEDLLMDIAEDDEQFKNILYTATNLIAEKLDEEE